MSGLYFIGVMYIIVIIIKMNYVRTILFLYSKFMLVWCSGYNVKVIYIYNKIVYRSIVRYSPRYVKNKIEIKYLCIKRVTFPQCIDKAEIIKCLCLWKFGYVTKKHFVGLYIY